MICAVYEHYVTIFIGTGIIQHGVYDAYGLACVNDVLQAIQLAETVIECVHSKYLYDRIPKNGCDPYCMDCVTNEQSGSGRASDRCSITTMHNCVYYLTHKDTGLRLRYYKTLAGARIAQRHRNSGLGFRLRLERINIDNWEVERCQLSDGTVIDATYVIIEDTIEQEELE